MKLSTAILTALCLVEITAAKANTIDATATEKHACLAERCLDCTDLTYEACYDKAKELGMLETNRPPRYTNGRKERPLEAECGNTDDANAYLNKGGIVDNLRGQIICPARTWKPRPALFTQIPLPFLGTWCWDSFQCSPMADQKAGEFYITSASIADLNKGGLSCTFLGGEVREWTLVGNMNCYPDNVHAVPYTLSLTLMAGHKLKVHMEQRTWGQ
jgi:hypothetical protein